MTSLHCEVAIVGGGLSGIAVAEGLAREGRDYRLLEARDRVGGRILSETGDGGRFDLGPAWIWPHNVRMLRLADRFGLAVHSQYSTGNLVFEDQTGAIRRDLSFATMGDALRIAGGTAALTEVLAAELDPARLHLSHVVRTIEIDGPSARIIGDGFEATAEHVVLSVPPRLAAEHIAFSPELDWQVRRALAAIPTWMAGHAKLVAAYDRAFWRDMGLSGDAISHVGPLIEIHDATDEAADVPALFGFLQPGIARQDRKTVEMEALAQLKRLFGPGTASPAQVWLKDWSTDPNTATTADVTPPMQHPRYGLPDPVRAWAGNHLIFAGTEAAPQDGGFLEGALEAAEAALAELSVFGTSKLARV